MGIRKTAESRTVVISKADTYHTYLNIHVGSNFGEKK